MIKKEFGHHIDHLGPYTETEDVRNLLLELHNNITDSILEAEEVDEVPEVPLSFPKERPFSVKKSHLFKKRTYKAFKLLTYTLRRIDNVLKKMNLRLKNMVSWISSNELFIKELNERSEFYEEGFDWCHSTLDELEKYQERSISRFKLMLLNILGDGDFRKRKSTRRKESSEEKGKPAWKRAETVDEGVMKFDCKKDKKIYFSTILFLVVSPYQAILIFNFRTIQISKQN